MNIPSQVREPRHLERAIPLSVLALLCVLAYAPSLGIPLLQDDYHILWASMTLGSLKGLPALLRDTIHLPRATSYWSTYILWRMFHMHAAGYRVVSLLLHIVNTGLVYLVARSWPRMRPAAFWAAAFFAIHEGHQEAVMWFSAINELLMFAFGMSAVLCYSLARMRVRRWPLDLAAVLLFVLALLSKESAVIFVPLLWLVAPERNMRHAVVRLWPYALLALLAMASIATTHRDSSRFLDGSFSLHAPVWITVPRNFGRLLWIWGWLAGVVILVSRHTRLREGAITACAWMAIALIPYSFLTYSAQIPSRHMYLASAGLSFLVGLALQWLWANRASRRGLVAAVLAVMLADNVGILWVKKRRHFLERAEPTERLIALARATRGAIWIQCFPQQHEVAESAVIMATGRPASILIWDGSDASARAGAAIFCCPKR